MRYLGGSLASLFCLTIGFAQAPTEFLIKQAAQRLQMIMSRKDESDLRWFTDEFFKDVPKEQLMMGLQERRQQLGELERHRLCRILSPTSAELELISKTGKRVKATIRIEPNHPFRFQYLMFGSVDLGDDTWDKLNLDIQKLPGNQAVSIVKLTTDQSKIFNRNSNDPLAVGSTFKLLILSLLCDEITAGKRKWTDLVALQEEARSLPSGHLQDWPIGSPLTLHTLATMMIARSDNTAADQLMLVLGRDALEKHQSEVGLQYPERNKPFLRTSELFKLKLVIPPVEMNAFAFRNEKQKRDSLPELNKLKLTDLRLASYPLAIDQIEWFFTTNDITRLLHRLNQGPQATTVRSILGITKPFDLDDFSWEYLGFKGGAEMGVLNLSLLGKLRKGNDWYAMSYTWNQPDKGLDEPAWIRLVQRSMLLLENGK